MHCTLMNEVFESLGNVSKYGLNVWNLQAMKGTGQESSDPSSNNASQPCGKKAKDHGGDGMEIAEVPVTDMTDGMVI